MYRTALNSEAARSCRRRTKARRMGAMTMSFLGHIAHDLLLLGWVAILPFQSVECQLPMAALAKPPSFSDLTNRAETPRCLVTRDA